MAIEVNLEKYGHKKKGFLGFSWTAFFFNFWVPIFRADFKWFLIFISPFIFGALGANLDLDFDNNFIALIFILPALVSKFVFPFIYNKFYTKGGYLEYTDEDLLDKEKMERYKVIIEEYENERKKDMHTIIIVFALIGVLIAFFYFMASYS